MSESKKFHYAWIILIAVSMIRGLSGPALNGSSGLFLTPVSEDIGVGIGHLSLYLSISSLATVIWLPIAGNIINRYSIKTIVLLGAVLQTFSFFALGFMNSVWGWFLLSVPLAMGGVLLVNLLGPVLINRWFAAKKGLVIGSMMAITSLLGAVFHPILTNLIANTGWQNAYKISGIAAFVCIAVVGIIFLKDKPGDKGIRPYGYRRPEGEHSTGKKNSGETPGVDESSLGTPAKTAVKSWTFYLLLLFMICFTGYAAFSQHIPTFGMNKGLTAKAIGMSLSLLMIGSALGSILIGIFSDRAGIIPTTLSVLAVGAAATVMNLFGGDSFYLFAAATFLHGLAMSAIGVVAPILTVTFFGSRDYEKLFSLVMMGAPLASIILLPGYGFVYDAMGNYNSILVFLLVLLALAGFCLMMGMRLAARTDGADNTTR